VVFRIVSRARFSEGKKKEFSFSGWNEIRSLVLVSKITGLRKQSADDTWPPPAKKMLPRLWRESVLLPTRTGFEGDHLGLRVHFILHPSMSFFLKKRGSVKVHHINHTAPCLETRKIQRARRRCSVAITITEQ
jgi:hypothetical protein